jgi:tetratricopeptide (TPR) repeat protein
MYRNLPHIRAANGPALSQYADLLKEGLPQSGAVVLSDDPPWRLFLLRAVLNSSQGTNHHVLVRTAGLEHPAYHNFLHRNYPEQWPWHKSAFTNLVADVIESPRLIQLMMELAQSNAVYYLHPSFGYYFEQFYLRPHGLVYEMKQFSDSAINPPPLTSDDIAENQAFWKRIDEETLSAVTRLIKTERRLTLTLGQRLMDSLHLKREPDRHALMLGTFYSRALNHWGVELQKTGRPEQSKEAAWCFARAQELNPDNVVAQVNEQYNQKLRAGHKSAVKRSKSVEDQFGKYRSWEAVIGANGPFDEPALCYEMGRTFAKGALYRQAAQQFERVKTLAPENLAARLWLAQLFNLWRMPDKVLEIAAQIHASDVPPDLDQINQIELAYLEASAQFAKTNFDAAEQVLEGTIKRFPNDENLLTVATQLYLGHGQYSNALATINTHLRLSPDNPSALVNKGFICIQLNSYKDAIEPLSRVLTLQTNNYEALFNRAVAYLRSGNLEAAQRDYEELQKVFPNAYQIYYGLGEIAFRKKDTSSAIRHYELYLTNSPANTEERKLVSARLDDLKKNGSP